MSSGSFKIQLNQLYRIYVDASIEHISDIAPNFVELLAGKERGNFEFNNFIELLKPFKHQIV